MAESFYTVYSDGGSRGNPGPAAYAFVIYDPEGQEVLHDAACLGETTNNQAEYQGIVAALEQLVNLELPGPVECRLDSQLVVRQINGQYKMKSVELQPWLAKIHMLVASLPYKVTFVDVPRAQNKVADSLVNKALDGTYYGKDT